MFTKTHFEKAEKVIENIIEVIDAHDYEQVDTYEPKIEKVETEARDGFIPWTEGGFAVTLPGSLFSAWAKGAGPEPVREILDRLWALAEKDWAETYPDRPSLNDSTADAEYCNEAAEYEIGYFEGDYFWKSNILFLDADNHQNKSGKPEVCINVYLNTDIDYGRDYIAWIPYTGGGKADQTVNGYHRVLTLDEFDALSDSDLEALYKDVGEALPI